jgi:cytochrome P450
MLQNPSGFLLHLSERAGAIGLFSSGPVQIVCVNEPSLIQSILIDNATYLEKMPSVKALAAFTGDGLLINDGPIWAKHRKLAAPAFYPQRIALYHQSIISVLDQLRSRWQSCKQINIGDEFKHLTLKIISKILFTYDLDSLATNMTKDIHLSLDYINRLAGVSAFPFLQKFLPGRKGFQEALSRIDNTVYDLIKVRRQQTIDKRPMDLLSLLIESRSESGEVLSDSEIRDEIITMLVAGHETTATVLTWAFILIAQHNAVQNQLYKESCQVIEGDAVGIEQLSHLPFAMQVFKEAMRLYPGGFTIGRRVRSDFIVGGYRFPKDTWVMISPYTVHRNSAVFHDPERFDPMRFIPEMERKLPKAAYVPFGLGSRICIGNNLALLEGQTIITYLMRFFYFTDVSKGPIKIKPMVTLSPDRPVIMEIACRPKHNIQTNQEQASEY